MSEELDDAFREFRDYQKNMKILGHTQLYPRSELRADKLAKLKKDKRQQKLSRKRNRR